MADVKPEEKKEKKPVEEKADEAKSRKEILEEYEKEYLARIEREEKPVEEKADEAKSEVSN